MEFNAVCYVEGRPFHRRRTRKRKPSLDDYDGTTEQGLDCLDPFSQADLILNRYVEPCDDRATLVRCGSAITDNLPF